MDRLGLLDETLRAFDSSLPRVTQSRCVTTRYRGSACRRCVDVCPVDAVTLAPLFVDADLCIACGACAAVCRTGALDYAQCRQLIHERLAEPDDGEAIVACSQADLCEAGVAPSVVMACLAGLSPADLIAAAAAARDGLVLISGDCRGCAAGQAAAAADLVTSQTLAWLHASGVPFRLERLATASSGAPLRPPAAAISRRDLFGLLMARGRVVAAAALASSTPRVEELHAVTPPPGVHARLLAALESLAARLERPAAGLPGDIPYASVEIMEACDACGLCARYCPHGALALAGGAVLVDGLRCTRCGLCAESCPREAVRVHSGSLMALATRAASVRAGDGAVV